MKNIIHGIGTISLIFFPLFLSLGMIAIALQQAVTAIIFFSVTLFMGTFIYLMVTNNYFKNSFRSVEEDLNQENE